MTAAAFLGERVDRREWSMMYVPRLNLPSRRGGLMLLAPTADAVPSCFESIDVDAAKYASLLAQLQRLRGEAYLADGAIDRAQLTRDGRHAQPVDDSSWHVLTVHNGMASGCARFRPHDAAEPEQLGVWGSPLAHDPLWMPWLRRTLEKEIKMARSRDQLFVEVGGWAIGEQRRCSTSAIDIALSMFALARLVGGCIGVTTATVRNHSSRILRKIGGSPLELDGCLIPTYYDPRYRCEMELLRFDSAAPNGRYEAQIERIAAGLVRIPVLCAAPSAFTVMPFAPGLRAVTPQMHEAYA